ncbi:MAPEG family protein [Limibacillus halophilus]|uniref:Putative MAPEG superfamily protein n=1 Tax=Limibacillus halophilus TaxID=1579333 RepID=A0A839SVG5_9PROT|nr:MAPEG family protein [Limibacillus halophilus]MBB3064965.1 putative MAPEG superfamily protein [Limibacillus halophilus]
MTTDLIMLALVAGLTALLWLPYILAHIVNVGLLPALTYTADGTPLPDWAARAKKAHYNAIENLAPFATLVLIAHVSGTADETTAAASVVYFLARLAHYPAYVSNIPFTRTISFAVGCVALLVIFLQVVF